LHGAEVVAVEVIPREGTTDGAGFAGQVQQKLERVDGVSRVLPDESKIGRARFKVESLQGRQVRPELARAVIESGWNLNELRAIGLSLEEIFLQLTATPQEAEPVAASSEKPEGEPAATPPAEEKPEAGASGEAQ
jgi:ABC-2 type transport system ATP-binding protein